MTAANCSTGNAKVQINTQSQRGVLWACVLVLAVFGGAGNVATGADARAQTDAKGETVPEKSPTVMSDEEFFRGYNDRTLKLTPQTAGPQPQRRGGSHLTQTPAEQEKPIIQTPFIELKMEVEQVAFEASKKPAPVYAVAFSPDGKIILTGSEDGYVRVWDAETRKELKKTKITAYSIVVSPDGKKTATTHSGGAVIIWDAGLGKNTQRLQHGYEVDSVSFSPDGKKIATACSGTIIWDAESGKELKTMYGKVVAFSPDGKKMIIGNTIWDAESGKELQKLEANDDLSKFAHFSPDGKKIVAKMFRGGVNIWDTESGKIIHRLDGSANDAAFSPDGKIVVVADGRGENATIWDVESGKALQKLQGHTDVVNDVAISPDGKKIVTASSDGTARIWDWVTIEKQLAEAEVQRLAEEKRKAEEAAQVAEAKRKAEAAEAKRIADEAAQVAEEERKAAEAKAKRIAERKAILAQTGAVDWNTEVIESGFRYLSDFIQYGNAKLKDDLQRADAFDKPAIEAKIRAAQEDIAKKTFYGEYAYSATEVEVGGDKSSFTMIIPAGFIAPKVEELVLPTSGTFKVKLDRRLTAPIVTSNSHGRYAFLLEEDKILQAVILGWNDIDGTFRAYLPNLSTQIGNDSLKSAIKDTSGRVLYARHGDPSNIVLSVSGTTDGIRELVRNSDNYQVRVWFKNLQYSKESKGVEYWLTNAFWRKNADVNDPRYDNPFVTSENETVATISADVVKIEIVKK